VRAALGVRTPIVPFTWPTLYTQHCAKAPPEGLGHCPLMREEADLHAEFAQAKELGIA
jgi:hypothetical protein